MCRIFQKVHLNNFSILVLFIPEHLILEAVLLIKNLKHVKNHFGQNNGKFSEKYICNMSLEKNCMIEQLRIIVLKNIASKNDTLM